jgi:triacylglycerol lipase
MTWWMLALAALAALAGGLAATIFALAIARWLRSRRRPRAPARPRFPVVLAHGFLGFDEVALGWQRHAYFRGIGARLEQMGAKVYSPRVPGVASIATRAESLAALIRSLPDERVNIVAHSMGGLDARYAISQLGLSGKVASLITIGTPHLGTPLADMGSKMLARLVRMLARFIDLRAFVDLTTAGMERFNRQVPDALGVAYGSVVGHSAKLRTHPLLWAPHVYLSKYAGPNDGLVPSASQPWGDVVQEIEADHWAQVGWSRGFDAVGLYEELLRDLRGKGF